MTYSQFKNKWLGKRVDYDKVYGFQSYIKVLFFSPFSSPDSFRLSFKQTKDFNTIVHPNSSLPFAPIFSKPYTSNATGIIRPNPSVSYISGVLNNPKIGTSIIKRIAVYVVDVKSFWLAHNPAMKLNKFIPRKSFLEVGFTSFDDNTPLSTKIFNSFKRLIINNSIKSSVSFRFYSNSFHNISLSNDSQKVKV